MKNAVIFHGTGGSPKKFWFPYVKKELEKLGYKVWVPQLPNPDNEKLDDWLPYILKNGEYNNETVLIGHSSGCPLILGLLEKLKRPVKQAILVAGFASPISKEFKPILQKKYYWEKIKSNCPDFTFINSGDDPWGCDDKKGKEMQKHLGGKLIIKNEGHFGSDKFKQSYKEFPLILSLVEKPYENN